MSVVCPVNLRSILPIIVIAATAWGVALLALGSPHQGIGDKKIALLQGCYAVGGTFAFRISDGTILAHGESPGFEAIRQKDRDVLSLDRPIEIATHGIPTLFRSREGASFIPIHYGNPLSLEFFDADYRAVFAAKARCPLG